MNTNSFNHNEKIYNYPIKTFDENDRLLLDKAKTTGMFFLKKQYIDYPKFWRNEQFTLPFNGFYIKKYTNIVFRTISQNLPYYDEGSRIEIFNHNSHPFKKEISFDKICPILNFGGNCWQHFVQDILPILIFNKEMLNQEEDIILLMYDELNINIIKFFFEKLNIKNRIFFVPYKSKYIIHAKNLYNFECNEGMPCWWWNFFFYKKINDKLLENEKIEKKNVIYNKRYNSRVFFNEKEVINCLKQYCEKNNLTFIEFDSKKFNISQTFDIFKNAHTIIAPHGGANYNIIFSSTGTKFIEYTFIDTMYTLYNIAGALNLNYYIVPNRGNNSTKGIYVDINKLEKLLNNHE